MYQVSFFNLLIRLNSLKNIFLSSIFFVFVFFGTACTNHQTAINNEEIAQLLQGFGRNWYQLQWKEEQLILLQPYEGVNTQFQISEDFENQSWIILLKKGFAETSWLVSSVEKKDNQYIFNLTNQKDETQKTILTYDIYSLQRKIGQWTELDKNLFFEFKTNFFTQKTTLWLFEEVFSTPSDENLTLETQDEALAESGVENTLATQIQEEENKNNLEVQKKSEWFRFTGGLGRAYYPITGFFCIKKNEANQNLEFVKGRYYYDKVWVDLKLIPSKEAENTWKLQEYSSLTPQQTTGFFLGEITESHKFSGYWHSADGQKTLAFDMDEKSLPYTLEDWQEENQNQTISFPQFPNEADNPAMVRFNSAIIKAKIKIWKKDFPQFDKIEYELLAANQNLINIVLKVKKQNKVLAIYCLNFDLEEAKEVKLRHLFEINADFEKEFYQNLNRAIRFHNQKYGLNITSVSQGTELESYNFTGKNIRILLFDKTKSDYIPFYISYKKLENFSQKATLERYQIGSFK